MFFLGTHIMNMRTVKKTLHHRDLHLNFRWQNKHRRYSIECNRIAIECNRISIECNRMLIEHYRMAIEYNQIFQSFSNSN